MPVSSGFEFPPGCVDPEVEAREREAAFWLRHFVEKMDRLASAYPQIVKEDPMKEEEHPAHGAIPHFRAKRQGIEMSWTPEAEAALAEARESVEVDDEDGTWFGGYPVIGYVEDDGDWYLLGLVICALGGAFTASAFWILAWSLWA